MTEAKLAILKKKLLQPKNFSDAMDYFLDHFATTVELIDRSEKVKIKVIEDMLAQICGQLFKKEPVILSGLMVFRIKEFKMIHSNCFAEGRQIVLFYLTDVDKGVFAVSNLATMKTEHVGRVSTLPLGDGDLDKIYDDVFDGREN